MFRKLILLVAISAVVTTGAFAQGAQIHPSPAGQKMTMSDSVTGLVKGKVDGKMFMLANKKGTYSVDASKAKVRMNGKFMSLAALTGGSMVTVKGHMMGMKIMASDVMVSRLNGKKK